MPHKDPEKRKQYKKDYMIRYRKLNPDYDKNYHKTDKAIKTLRICNWKRFGVKHNNFDELYDYYISVNECENCGCELDKCNKSRKCLDHDHTTGLFRNVICHYCNIIRG